MRVSVYVGSLFATYTSRILPLTKSLESYDISSNVIPPINWHSITKGWLGNALSMVLTYYPGDYVKTLQNPPDVVIISKISTPKMYLLEKYLKRRGVRVIFDLNDAIFLPTSRLFGVKIRPGSFFLEKIVRNADFVTVNGHYIRRYVRYLNEHVRIIHDPVDTSLFSPKSKNRPDKITIGWEGVPSNHYENLSMLIKPLSRLSSEYDIRFKFVCGLGDLKLKKMFNELENKVKIDYGPKYWVPFDEFPELISDFDIMVAPLKGTPWYEGKSALRAGISMAMGIPIVASPVGEQKYVIKHGVNGFLAKNDEEWYQYLKILIEDNKLQETIGKNGRETAEKELSLDVCGKKLFKILTKVVN